MNRKKKAKEVQRTEMGGINMARLNPSWPRVPNSPSPFMMKVELNQL